MGVKPKQNTQSESLSKLLPLLRCPTCDNPKTTLSNKAEGLACSLCNTTFPIFKSGNANIPWLFPKPQNALLEWKARLNGFLQMNAAEQARLGDALDEQGSNGISRERIKHSVEARQVHRGQILELLAPLCFDGIDLAPAQDRASLAGRNIAGNQGLSSYQDNIFRDWSWDNGENEHLLSAVESVLDDGNRAGLGKVLTLGAGACRLSYDLHRIYSPELSVLLDINPLLLFMASRVIAGETVPLYEFPIAPLDDTSFAVMQECLAPEPMDSDENFQFILADALQAPLASASFDTVVTPWLIDIIPQDLRDFIPRVNQLLEVGGVWLNTGSLAFFHANEAWRYSEAEVLQLLAENGFEVSSATRRTAPYLQSPVSAHGRTENAFSFSARKTREAGKPPRYEYLPGWIRETHQAIPGSDKFVIASSNHLLQTQVLAAIDGKRTIDEIGELIAKHYELDVAEATYAVIRILIEEYEASQSPAK
jgi:uncharacterized protein YbaR (Trm112 family)